MSPLLSRQLSFPARSALIYQILSIGTTACRVVPTGRVTVSLTA